MAHFARIDDGIVAKVAFKLLQKSHEPYISQGSM